MRRRAGSFSRLQRAKVRALESGACPRVPARGATRQLSSCHARSHPVACLTIAQVMHSSSERQELARLNRPVHGLDAAELVRVAAPGLGAALLPPGTQRARARALRARHRPPAMPRLGF